MNYIIYAVSLFLTAIIFGVRQEGRITVEGTKLSGRIDLQQQRVDDLKDLIQTGFEAQSKRLDRIERSLNGHLVRD